MGCYFSKEISDLVLMYSEYKYLLVSSGKGLKVLKRYADDGIMIFCGVRSYVIREVKKLMLFYPNNLTITLKYNQVRVQYLDLFITIDDITAVTKRLHYRTYFKKFHKFAYLDPGSNHPDHVFNGLIRTESIRYVRNSSSEGDYEHSFDLFLRRLMKLGFKKRFILRNKVVFKDYLDSKGGLISRRKRAEGYIRNKVVVPVVFNRNDGLYVDVKGIIRGFRKARINEKLMIVPSVMPKLRNIISTRKILHGKMARFSFKPSL